MKFKGTAVAMVTPFTNSNEVDFNGLKENIEHLIDNGVDALLIAGTTGESATITHEEQRSMMKFLVDEVDGRVTTLAGSGSNSSKEALGLVEYAENIGADNALVITPYYNKPQMHGLFEHYKLMTSTTDIPIIVYNVPSRTGTDIDVDTILKVAELDNIVGIKEANPDLDKVSKIKAGLLKNGLDDKFAIISGNDDLTLPMMSIGATGVISVVANVDPKRMSDMVNHALADDYENASKLHYELYDLMKVLFIESNPVPTKEALNLMKMPAGTVRLPLVPMKKESNNKVKEVLDNLGLL
ncbi:MAG: 4-hydroxy-tetrahydrodipicolinate synthase [Methanobacteriaceae archaeon]